MFKDETQYQNHIQLCENCDNCDICLNILVQNFIKLIKINRTLSNNKTLDSNGNTEKYAIFPLINGKINNISVHKLIKTTNENKRDNCIKLLEKFKKCTLDLSNKKTLFKNITEVCFTKPPDTLNVFVQSQLETYGYNVPNEYTKEIIKTLYRQVVYTIIVNSEYSEEFMNCNYAELTNIGSRIISLYLNELNPYICAITTLIAKNKYLK